MSAPLVMSYGFDSPDGETVTLSFSIPDNCEYTMTVKEGVYWIYVNLQTGENQPSGNYVPYTIKLDPIKSIVSVQFEQESYADANGDGDGTETTTTLRPKIRIDE